MDTRVTPFTDVKGMKVQTKSLCRAVVFNGVVTEKVEGRAEDS